MGRGCVFGSVRSCDRWPPRGVLGNPAHLHCRKHQEMGEKLTRGVDCLLETLQALQSLDLLEFNVKWM